MGGTARGDGHRGPGGAGPTPPGGFHARAFRFGVGTLDPLSLAGGTPGLLAVAALASWIPARRAAGSDPVDVLRVQ